MASLFVQIKQVARESFFYAHRSRPPNEEVSYREQKKWNKSNQPFFNGPMSRDSKSPKTSYNLKMCQLSGVLLQTSTPGA